MDAGVRKEVDGMGTSEIKYGDSVCYIQHVNTGLWLTYQAVDVKSVRMGATQRKVRWWGAPCTARASQVCSAHTQGRRGGHWGL